MGIHTSDIEQIRPELTWRLRHLMLYPNKGINAQGMPEDTDGTHFGAFYQGWLVGVVSLFNNGTDFQFRKLAVDADLQGKSIGTQLLQYITRHALDSGATRLWCNARISATGFYIKAGFVASGEVFTRNGIEYIIMEKYPNKNRRLKYQTPALN